MKTALMGILLWLGCAGLPLAGQTSPLQWPVPPPGPPRQPPRILIRAEDLAGLIAQGKALPLDARGPVEFKRGHLRSAVPAWRPEEETGGIDKVRELVAARGIAGDHTVVLYGNPDREAVAHLFWLLRWAGVPDVRVLDGGLAAWRAAGGAVATGPFHRKAVQRRAAAGTTAAVDVGWLFDSFGEARIALLDVRDARGWDRWQTPPTFAAGHIPYSLPFDPAGLLAADGSWPEPGELRRRLKTLGPRPGDPVNLASTFVIYGDDERDPRIALGYLLLSLAGVEARVFPGGWQEWRSNAVRPVVRVVTAAELAARLKRENPGLDRDLPPHGLILIDLREEADFAIGHLPGARFLPSLAFGLIFKKMVADGWPGADRATLPIVLYCYGLECVRSRKAGTEAARLGFRDVIWFRGGVTEWRAASLPLLDSQRSKAPGRDRAASPAAGAARPSP